jgi:hypothetical protein
LGRGIIIQLQAPPDEWQGCPALSLIKDPQRIEGLVFTFISQLASRHAGSTTLCVTPEQMREQSDEQEQPKIFLFFYSHYLL